MRLAMGGVAKAANASAADAPQTIREYAGIAYRQKLRIMLRPRDPNQLAKLMVDLATGQVDDKADSRPEDEGKAATVFATR